MIKIITKKKYDEMVVRLKQFELSQEAEIEKPLRAFIDLDKERERSQKYKKLYVDELQKRLEWAEIVKRFENDHKRQNKSNVN